MNSVLMLARNKAVVAYEQAALSKPLRALAAQYNRMSFGTLQPPDDRDYNDFGAHRFEENVAELHDIYLKAHPLIQTTARTPLERAARCGFAVESPDGTSDDDVALAMRHVDQIIRYAAEHEDIDEIIQEHQRSRKDNYSASKIWAVDGPDGLPDDEIIFAKKQVQQIIRFAAEHEDIDEVIREHQVNRKDNFQAGKIYAVDAPDGMPDIDDEAHFAKQYVSQVIRYAAEHEDIDEVIQEHQRNRKDKVQADRIFAVDAPDGMPDDEVMFGNQQVAQIIRFAAEHEDIDEVIKEHQVNRKDAFQAGKIYAVDGPDGVPDVEDEVAVAMKHVAQIIRFAAENEDVDEVIRDHQFSRKDKVAASKIFAVDGPDGTPDVEDETELARQQVAQIIRYASEHEDIDEVIREHQRNRKDQFAAGKVFAVDGPDGTPDVEDEVEFARKQVEQIIRFAAEHEDIDEVIKEHQRNRKDAFEASKIFAVDGPDGLPDEIPVKTA